MIPLSGIRPFFDRLFLHDTLALDDQVPPSSYGEKLKIMLASETILKTEMPSS